MARPPSVYPTELELDILKVIWREGASTVRQVREGLAPVRNLAHTSVITIMNIMTEKRYLARNTEGNSHVYRARVSENSVRKRMLADLARRAFSGSAAAMMLNLLETSDLKQDEIAELRRRLEAKKRVG